MYARFDRQLGIYIPHADHYYITYKIDEEYEGYAGYDNSIYSVY
jgi:hypothetical protein